MPVGMYPDDPRPARRDTGLVTGTAGGLFDNALHPGRQGAQRLSLPGGPGTPRARQQGTTQEISALDVHHPATVRSG